MPIYHFFSNASQILILYAIEGTEKTVSGSNGGIFGGIGDQQTKTKTKS